VEQAAPWPSSPWPGTTDFFKIHHLPSYHNFSPDEALMALAVMHNYAPEQYKVDLLKHQIMGLSGLHCTISAHAYGGPSGGSNMCRSESEDPHRREQKFYFSYLFQFKNTAGLCVSFSAKK
jgi:hypothetical protein